MLPSLPQSPSPTATSSLSASGRVLLPSIFPRTHPDDDAAEELDIMQKYRASTLRADARNREMRAAAGLPEEEPTQEAVEEPVADEDVDEEEEPEDDDPALVELKEKVRQQEERLEAWTAPFREDPPVRRPSHGGVLSPLSQRGHHDLPKEIHELKRKYNRLRQLYSSDSVAELRRRRAYAREREEQQASIDHQARLARVAQQVTLQFERETCALSVECMQQFELIQAQEDSRWERLTKVFADKERDLQLTLWVQEEKKRLRKHNELRQHHARLLASGTEQELEAELARLRKEKTLRECRIRRKMDDAKLHYATQDKGRERVAKFRLVVLPGHPGLAKVITLAKVAAEERRRGDLPLPLRGLRFLEKAITAKFTPGIPGIPCLSKVLRIAAGQRTYLNALQRSAALDADLRRLSAPYHPALSKLLLISQRSQGPLDPHHVHGWQPQCRRLWGLRLLHGVLRGDPTPPTLRHGIIWPRTSLGRMLKEDFQQTKETTGGLGALGRTHKSSREERHINPHYTYHGLDTLFRHTNQLQGATAWQGTPFLYRAVCGPPNWHLKVKYFPALDKVRGVAACTPNRRWRGLHYLEEIAVPVQPADAPVVMRGFEGLGKVVTNSRRANAPRYQESRFLALLRRVCDATDPTRQRLRKHIPSWLVGSLYGISRVTWNGVAKTSLGYTVRETQPDVLGRTAFVGIVRNAFLDPPQTRTDEEWRNMNCWVDGRFKTHTSPTTAEVVEYAEYLGIDVIQEAHLMWIAHKGLTTPLPDGWRPCYTSEGALYFFNFHSGDRSWEHPADHYLCNLVRRERLQTHRPKVALCRGMDTLVGSLDDRVDPAEGSVLDFTAYPGLWALVTTVMGTPESVVRSMVRLDDD